MLVLIDESGCSGFKVTSGSTAHFIAVMVIFDSFDEAERTSNAINHYRKQNKLRREFKFSKDRNEVRDGFMMAVKPYDFKIRALVVDKSKVESSHLKLKTESFYNFFIKSLLNYDNSILKNARVKIDGSGDRKFRKELSKYLKGYVGAGKIKSVKLKDSKNDNLIQLADMVAGAIARSYKPNRKDHDKWRKMLNRQIDNVWEFK